MLASNYTSCVSWSDLHHHGDGSVCGRVFFQPSRTVHNPVEGIDEEDSSTAVFSYVMYCSIQHRLQCHPGKVHTLAASFFDVLTIS